MNIDGKWMFNGTRGDAWGGDKYDTREAAIVAGRKEYPGKDFYVGRCEQIIVPAVADAEHAIELIGENLDDEYGGCDFDPSDSFYEGVTDEMEEELQQALETVVKDWIRKHEICKGYYVIRNVERIALEEEGGVAK